MSEQNPGYMSHLDPLKSHNYWQCQSCDARFPRIEGDEDVERCSRCVELEAAQLNAAAAEVNFHGERNRRMELERERDEWMDKAARWERYYHEALEDRETFKQLRDAVIKQRDEAQRRVGALTEALQWALDEGGWRLIYFSNNVPPIIKHNGMGGDATIDLDAATPAPENEGGRDG